MGSSFRKEYLSFTENIENHFISWKSYDHFLPEEMDHISQPMYTLHEDKTTNRN